MKSRGFKTIILNLLKQDRNYFTLNQIVKDTGLPRENVRDVLIELAIDDYLLRIKKVIEPRAELRLGPSMKNVTYRVRSPKKLAIKIAPKFKDENSFDKMWLAIRKLRFFTRRDLLQLVSNMEGKPIITIETVRWFTKMLARAGIIANDGHSGNWRLVKDVGPKRPYVGDKKKVRSSE